MPSVSGYGAERLIVELLKRLPSPEIDAALLTIYEPPPGTSESFPFPVYHAGRKNRRDRLFIWRLVQEIRRRKPDIVHTHTHVGKYWGRIAAMLAGTKIIVHTEHNPCDFRRTKLERAADWILHRATSRVVTFFTEQGAALIDFESLPKEKLVLIPNGLTLAPSPQDRAEARKKLNIESAQFAIMTIGRMEYQKNHILALRAFAALPEELRRKTLLLFAGSGEEEIVLRGLAHALGIADRVRFLGYRNDVASLLAGVDLVLMTSWFEGMPLALLEAMIAGVPIVSTPWLGARSMLADGRFGFLTPTFEAPEVAAEIQRAFRHARMRNEVAERARKNVFDAYDIQRMVAAHRRLYLQVGSAAS
ncbi:MAG: glycosyltransferase [Candidatus Baltobacteraceae bacterium]